MIIQDERNFKRGDFFSMPKLAYESDLSPLAITVYGYLMYCRDERNQCWPSRKNIAKRCNIKSVSTVDKYMKELEDNGLVCKTNQTSSTTKQKTSNLYDMPYIERPNSRRRKR